jgi:chemotaxis protein histidine kinase CheA
MKSLLSHFSCSLIHSVLWQNENNGCNTEEEVDKLITLVDDVLAKHGKKEKFAANLDGLVESPPSRLLAVEEQQESHRNLWSVCTIPGYCAKNYRICLCYSCPTWSYYTRRNLRARALGYNDDYAEIVALIVKDVNAQLKFEYTPVYPEQCDPQKLKFGALRYEEFWDNFEDLTSQDMEEVAKFAAEEKNKLDEQAFNLAGETKKLVQDAKNNLVKADEDAKKLQAEAEEKKTDDARLKAEEAWKTVAASKEAVPKAEAEAKDAMKKVGWVVDERGKRTEEAKKLADETQKEALIAEAEYKLESTDERKQKKEAAEKKRAEAKARADNAQKLYQDATKKAAELAAP